MDLIINSVWIGPNKLGWLECFMIYSWKRLGCTVNLFTHYPSTFKVRNKTHDHDSLGVPASLVNVHSLKTLVEGAGLEGGTMPKTRAVLRGWFPVEAPFGDAAKRLQAFNMVDLCKSYIAATQRGIVMDLKIGPSPHIEEFYKKGVFDLFVGCRRARTVENQLMGSMSESNTRRSRYGAGFDFALFDEKRRRPDDLIAHPHNGDKKWYSDATAAHNRAMGSNQPMLAEGLAGDWFDLGKYGKPYGDTGLGECAFEGIAGEPEAGAVRIFKKEEDQTNKMGNVPTTLEERLDAQRMALTELDRMAPGADQGDMKTLRTRATYS